MVKNISDREVESLLSKVEKERGLDCTQFRLSYVKRRIGTRLRANKVDSFSGYYRLLDKKPEEYQKLIDALTINVSEFFRDKDVYQILEGRMVPKLLERKLKKNQTVVRVWSAGCATGEEPYSIAMIFKGKVNDYPNNWVTSIYATDVDSKALDLAKRGEYPRKKLSEIPKRYWQAAVLRGNGAFSIKPEVKNLVKFKKKDLFADNNLRYMDIVFCRNVLIYFSREQQIKLYRAFRKALKQGGFLVIGRTEKLIGEGSRLFRVIDPENSIYQK